MKKSLIIGTIGLFIVGGAIGVGASNLKLDDDNHESASISEIQNNTVNADVNRQESNATTVSKTSDLISREEAIQIAEKSVNGKAYSFEMDEDDGQIEYEIELKTDRGEVEIEMNGRNGEIIEIDYDDDDFDDNDD